MSWFTVNNVQSSTQSVCLFVCLSALWLAPASAVDVLKDAEDMVDYYSSASIAQSRQESLDLMASGHHVEAVVAIQQLQGIIHRVHGVNSLEQTESLLWLIESYTALNQLDEVDRQHAFLFSLAERTFDKKDPRLQYARLRLASWYLRSTRYRPALSLYKDISEWAKLDLPQHAEERNNVLLHALRREALTRYVAGICCASKPLLRARDLVKESDDFDFEDKQMAQQDYLNILMLERRPKDALPLLQSLAEEHSGIPPTLLGFPRPSDMASVIQGLIYRRDEGVKPYYPAVTENDLRTGPTQRFPPVLGYPMPMCGMHFQKLLRGDGREGLAELYIDVSLRVNSSGNARDIEMSGTANSRIRRYIKYALRKSRFRPGITATGEIDPTRYEFRQVFTPPETIQGEGVGSWNRLLASHTCQLTIR